MHCYLLNLPAELQLKIIGKLLQDEDASTHIKTHRKDEDYQSDKQDEPIQIYHHLIKWSCTCYYFRTLLAPTIFRSTKLVNDEKSGSSLNTIAMSLHNIHVRELHFIGSAPAFDKTDFEEVLLPNTEEILPSSVEMLLSDLQRFPNLEKLSIKFDNEPAMEDWWDIRQPSEESSAWRALIFKTYSALIQNKSPHFEHLEIRQLFWLKVSLFSHIVFHDFLGHFEQLSLSIYGQSLDEEYTSSVADEYPKLMGKLEEYFFNHLAKLTTLSIKAPRAAPLGLEGLNHAPLTLRAYQMPLLTTLYLDYIFASPELINFLVSHKNTLETLTLRNCYASLNYDCIGHFTHDGICWSKFFTSLSSACPARLHRFEIAGSDLPLPRKREFDNEGGELVRAILRQDPGKILFPYASLDEDTGRLFYDAKETFEAFLKGEDQRSWDRLIGLMEENANKITTTKSESKFAEWHARSYIKDVSVM